MDRPGLAVHRRHADHLGAVCHPDGLVAETDAEDRHRWSQLTHQLHADARLLGTRGTGRDDDRVGPLGRHLGHGELVVAGYGRLRADPAEQLDQVEGERVVVVQDEDALTAHPGTSAPMAASMLAAFAATSAASRDGMESATTPAPAWTVASPSLMTAERMVM